MLTEHKYLHNNTFYLFILAITCLHNKSWQAKQPFCAEAAIKHQPTNQHVLEETFDKTVQKVATSPKVCANLGNLNRQIQSSTQYLHVHFNESLNSRVINTRINTTGTIISKIVKCVVSHIVFTPYARNVCLQHERKHVDAGSMTPTAHSVNSVIQTVHSFMMRHLSSSASEISVRAGGGHFEHVV